MDTNEVKILAIDDNLDNLIILKALIRETFPDFKVITTLSGKEGLALASRLLPDVILLDIVMPVMDGFEVCRQLKSDPDLIDIPVVFVTALKADKESRIRGLEAGAEAFLAKPIDKSELIAQIRAMIKIKNANISKKMENIQLAALVSDRTSELEKTNMATLNLLEDLRQENEARRKTEEALMESQEQLQKFAAHLQHVREEERILLAREIHDDLGQNLVAIKIEIGMLMQRVPYCALPDYQEDIMGQFNKLAGLVNDTIQSTRRIMTDLRPVVLDFLGFLDAGKQHLESFAERNKIKCLFVNDIDSLNMDIQKSVALFRILQESLNNIAKHAEAKSVTVHVGRNDYGLFLEISDDGKGFDVQKKTRLDSYGLLGMNERTYLLNGRFSVKSSPGNGTVVRVEIPVDEGVEIIDLSN